VLEVTGGFTGPAGKQTIDVETSRLPAPDRERIERDLERLPSDALGSSHLKAHPQSWDFVHELKVGEGVSERTARFHLDEGPPALSTLARHLTELAPEATRRT
jgi:hypothetical protein